MLRREHRAREPLRHGRRHAAEQLAGDPRAEEHDQIGDVPADAARTSLNTSAPERREDPPQADAAGVEEAPERDHRQGRSEQDRDLADAEQELAEVARAREDDDRAEQRREVHERHPADGRAEGEIQARPQQPRPAGSAPRSATRSALPARVSSSSRGSAPICASRASTRSAPLRMRVRASMRLRGREPPRGSRPVWRLAAPSGGK